MNAFIKYLPHLGITALILFLGLDYFSLTPKRLQISGGELQATEGSHTEGSHSEGSHGMGEEMPGANLPQEERERRMGIFHYNEGNKFFKDKNYNEAIIRYQKAIQHHKGFQEAIINLSSAYMKNKEFDKALETLKAGQKQFPKAALIDFNLACYYSLTQNLESGLSALKTAVDKGYKQFKQIENDPDLQNLRNSALYQEWKAKIPGGI